jgi:hypothetical protein
MCSYFGKNNVLSTTLYYIMAVRSLTYIKNSIALRHRQGECGYVPITLLFPIRKLNFFKTSFDVRSFT